MSDFLARNNRQWPACYLKSTAADFIRTGLNKERNNSPELREELQNGSVFFPYSQDSRVAQQFVVPNVLVDVDVCTEVLEEEHRGTY